MKAGKKRAISAAVLVTCVAFAAVFGFYQLASTLLNKMYPPAENTSLAVVSKAASSEAEETSSDTPAPASSGSDAVSKASFGGIFSGYEDAARKKLSTMSLKEKIGQVFLFECPESGAIKTIDDDSPCGYCLSASDFKGKTADAVKKTLNSYQNSSKIPMILCCDEEGGTAVRVSENPALSPSKFRSPQEVFQRGGMDGITSDTVKKAKLLRSLGINVNLAPVCDVSTDAKDFIYARSFGKDAQKTSEFVTASVNAYGSVKTGCVLKHFPGYGSNADTHTGIAYDSRSYQTFQKSDFLPFEAGIKAGAACVMVSHNIVESMDAERPASLSPQVHEILREKLGFTGVVMSDSLSMGAIKQYTKGQNPAVSAFEAGNDILLTSDISSSYNALYLAVAKGTVTEKRLDESVLRILAWKMQLGIIS